MYYLIAKSAEGVEVVRKYQEHECAEAFYLLRQYTALELDSRKYTPQEEYVNYYIEWQG